MAIQSVLPSSIGLVVLDETGVRESAVPGLFVAESSAAHIGAAQMDGATNVLMVSRNFAGAAQMDGLTTPSFHGALSGAKGQMDGIASVSFAGRISGGVHIGAAEMDGVASVAFHGAASGIHSGAATMNGQGSMLAVTAAVPLPPHGALLAAGM